MAVRIVVPVNTSPSRRQGISGSAPCPHEKSAVADLLCNGRPTLAAAPCALFIKAIIYAPDLSIDLIIS